VHDRSARLAEIETLIGSPVPPDYVRFLRNHREDEPEARMVSTNPDDWGVRSVFEMTDGPDYRQVDAVVRIVHDVLPPATLPVAEDEAGNLYLLDCGDGPSKGQVGWWNHERELGDHQIDPVAASFTAFLASLVPDDR
jgi:cell wall assembly regulator SMI1